MRRDESSGILAGGGGGMDGAGDPGGERVAGAARAGEGVAWGNVDRRGVDGVLNSASDGLAGAAAAGGCDGSGAVLRRYVLRSGWGGGSSGFFDSRRQPVGAGVGEGEQQRAWAAAERGTDSGVPGGCPGSAVGGVGGRGRGAADGPGGGGGCRDGRACLQASRRCDGFGAGVYAWTEAAGRVGDRGFG